MFEQSTQVLDIWLERLNAGELERTAALYSRTAILLPTFSGKAARTPKAVRNYFETLSTHKNLQVSLHPDSVVVQRISERIHCISGLYCWRFEPGNEGKSVEARFTFVVDLTLEAPIIHHHSSRKPEAPEDP